MLYAAMFIYELVSFEGNNSLTINIISTFMIFISLLIYYLGVSELGACFSPCTSIKKPSEIVKTGIYSIVGHPIYSSGFILVLGWSIILNSLFLFCDSPSEAYGTWRSNIKIVLPEGLDVCKHNTRGKDKISFDKVLNKSLNLIS